MTSEPTKTEVGSYFISNYPPFSTWNQESLVGVESALQSPPTVETPLGLYLHIPFCRKRCKFCYFKVFTENKASDIELYVSALSREIELVSELPVMGGRPFRFVYFGGGTPSFLSPKQLTSLVDRLRANINWDDAEEVTFECEPGTLSEPKIQTLKQLGVTRLSLGVENFNDEILEENGRAHLSPEVYKSWEWIKKADFDNVNIDLISGMVGETDENWQENIRLTIELDPESVTIYQMELPFNTVYSQDILGNRIETPVADWPTKRRWVDEAFTQLEEAGYHVSSAYTMVKNPEKVTFSYRDNLWKGSDLLATGIASFGHISGVHYQNLPEWDDYVGTLLNDDRLPLGRGNCPSTDQLLIREMILQLKKGYLDTGYFQDKFSVDILQKWESTWSGYEQEGLLHRSENRI
ncbi:MAG: coproporphyrinogen-III oxidase family protein, partial [Pirellulaceae bacterium]